MKKVVDAIDLILTNQRNNILIQWEERKTRQSKRCKDKFYAQIRCQISRNAIREIDKQVERSWDALDKRYHYLFVQTHSEKQCNSFIRMSWTGLFIKINQFLLSVFIGIGDLPVVLTGTLEKKKGTRNQIPILHIKVLQRQMKILYHLGNLLYLGTLLHSGLILHLEFFILLQILP